MVAVDNAIVFIFITGVATGILSVGLSSLAVRLIPRLQQLSGKSAYDAQHVLDELAGIFVKATTLEQLVERTSVRLAYYLQAESVAVSMTTHEAAQQIVYTSREAGQQLDVPTLTQAHMMATHTPVMSAADVQPGGIADELSQNAIGLVCQLRTQNKLVGYMLFGNKVSGAQYTRRDIEFIDIVSDELAIALQNMLRFQEISRFNDELQQKIDSATVELQTSNQKLQELDKSKDEFISMASHQLRTPLTAVKGYISMILEGDIGTVSADQRQMLEQAYDSSQRMVYLIGDFLNVSRLQTGKFELERSQFDIVALVAEEVEQLDDTAKARGVTLRYNRPHEPMMVSADETKIRQVIMNFCDNAIYYTKPQTTIDVTLHTDKDHVIFKVRDKGIGVPQSEQKHLFTKFFRASNAKRQRPDGTGIGLFMAKKVIIAHHGALVFETVENEGSTFGFQLPKNDNNITQLSK